MENSDVVVNLRQLFNDVENCVPNVKCLDVETSTYGCLVIPILKARLPDDLVLLISRKFEGNVWTLGRLLKFISDELIAKETWGSIFNSKTKSHSDDISERGQYTANSFLSDSREFHKDKNRCVSYNSESHSPSQCGKVSNVKPRMEILGQNFRLFLCLKSGQFFKNCTSSHICGKCDGKHHISLCSKLKKDQEKDESSAKSTDNVAAHVVVLKGTLLQTAKRKVIGINTDETWTTTRVLFDTGSQRTYLTENIRKHLKLEKIWTENVINTFGTLHESKLETLDVVQLKIKHRYENRCIFVEALCYPVICKPLKNQEIAFDRSKFGNFSKLELAGFIENSLQLLIGSLVGVDYYHQFFTGKAIKNEAVPLASSSVVRWVLSGSFPWAERSSSFSNAEIHSISCFLERKLDKNDFLREEMNRFWEIDTIRKLEENVTDQFEKEIQFNGTRYVAKLPFKTDHDLLPDNFEVSKISYKI